MMSKSDGLNYSIANNRLVVISTLIIPTGCSFESISSSRILGADRFNFSSVANALVYFILSRSVAVSSHLFH